MQKHLNTGLKSIKRKIDAELVDYELEKEKEVKKVAKNYKNTNFKYKQF